MDGFCLDGTGKEIKGRGPVSPAVMGSIKENFERLQGRILSAAQRSSRMAADISLVAVTKNVPVQAILEAQTCGVGLFAENRVQDAAEKIPLVPGVQWHMVGHLQTNKIRAALDIFHCIQSVDSVRLAKEIHEALLLENRVLPVLLEVQLSPEPQKFGFKPEEIYAAVDAIRPFTTLDVQGVMGLAPNTPDAQARRDAFKKLKGVFTVLKSMKSERFQMKTLSMGMSDDFEIAIEEGSNMIRIGRALFARKNQRC